MQLARRCAYLGLVLFLLPACEEARNVVLADGGGVDGGGDAIVNPCGEPDPNLAAMDADEFFGRTKIPTFDLHLPADAWADLQAHARDEIYVPAQACLDGKAIGLVGLRFKGSYGSLYNCFDANGKNTCRKLGMKIKFDEYVEDQRVAGLDRLNFQGYRYDGSYMKEALTYDLYRAMGVKAPRSSWAKLRVNGELQGLFGLVEEIDKRFVKDRWPGSPDGNLFKEVWPGQTDEEWMTSHLHTNKTVADVSAFKAFSEALNAASDADLRTVLGNHVDLDYWARYMAVDDAVANFDGVTTYYTSGSLDEAGNHNFYIYQESATKFTIIPWDEESTLSTASNFGNVPYWQTLPADCTQQYGVWGGLNKVIAPGCNRVFRALAADTTAWHTHAQALLDGPFTVANMTANVEKIVNLIRAEAIADPHGPGENEFKNSVGYIKQDVPRLRARLEHFMSGLPSTPQVLVTTAVNGFETSDSYGLIDGTMQMSNPSSTMSVTVNTTAPLAGSKSVRIDFSFANETAPWQQWMLYTVPFDSTPKNLGTYTGIRMKMRSNVARTVRINFMSPNNPRNSEGVAIGWDVDVTATAATYTVNFATAETQSWAGPVADDHALIFKTGSGIQWMPQCNGRGTAGQLPAGTTDTGWVDIDDVEFF